jgi:CheY-like chemotaxis protein
VTATTVLIIDDEVHIRRLIARMLHIFGFTTLEAADGQQAINLINTARPDVVTCDISMRGMDGYDFLTEVKKNPDTQQIPVIMVTALGQETEIKRAVELGADNFLTKPFSASHLVEIIESQLNR